MRHKQNIRSWLAVLALVVAWPTFSVEPKKSCRAHPKIIGECFHVRGKLFLANGTPSVRLSKTGTNRILGVSEGNFVLPGYRNLPEALEKKLGWENEILGDFLVCPFTASREGVMQFICIESGENFTVKERRQ